MIQIDGFTAERNMGLRLAARKGLDFYILGDFLHYTNNGAMEFKEATEQEIQMWNNIIPPYERSLIEKSRKGFINILPIKEEFDDSLEFKSAVYLNFQDFTYLANLTSNFQRAKNKSNPPKYKDTIVHESFIIPQGYYVNSAQLHDIHDIHNILTSIDSKGELGIFRENIMHSIQPLMISI